ncbi:Glycosyl transferases group 1 [Muriicola jejuensis]|uniref:Glycosyltransferase n=1 Tax=Muriicola jejuensis TaxID=504488 RepID=A0A6P0UI55_9FLAO|nr:glycosyltransferase family 4 protein [Muriicola jejuensis]NER11538.1 glycosyltransferase [Muriicola jejuensis]SMP19856.1 Glycosyl transferases group 1 [Muriicola jejuensis]
MRILYLALGFPDMDTSQNMFTELVLEFHKNGHNIDVVAPVRNQSRTGLQLEAGIRVIRVPTLKLFNVGLIQKGLANLLLPFQYKKALKKSGFDLSYDLIIMSTPPITLDFLAKWFKFHFGSKIYLILRDIFPQNAVDLKMMSYKSPFYKYFRKKEKALYKLADFIGCMSQGNIDYVLRHNPEVQNSKLHLLPNWRTPIPNLEDKEINEIKAKFNLTGKFVVFFGGNMGKPQKLENIVYLAEACRDIEDVIFFLVGDGNERVYLEQLVKDAELQNIILQGQVSPKDYHRLLQSADIGIISLSQDFTIPNIPSKTISYFNAKKPVLASIDKNTDFGKLLEESGAGLWCEAGNTPEMKKALQYLMEHKAERIEMGLKGYKYLQENLLTSMAYERIMAQVSH